MVIEVNHDGGLHARPAAEVAKAAAGFDATIRVRNVTRDTRQVSAASIVALLGLGLQRGHQLEVTADGPHQEAALTRVSQLLAGRPRRAGGRGS